MRAEEPIYDKELQELAELRNAETGEDGNTEQGYDADSESGEEGEAFIESLHTFAKYDEIFHLAWKNK